MPHKVNPINFENAEGNLKLCSNMLQFLSSELPISRLQRDLTDSTLVRNLGSILGYFMISINSILTGFTKLDLTTTKINDDLNENPIIIAEAIQTILRRENYSNPYEKINELTQNKKVSKNDLELFIKDLDISNKIKEELLTITPHNYIGYIK